MCKYSSDKELNKLVRKLIQQGWTYKRRGKHGRLICPLGTGQTTVPGSPSDYRALRNFKKDIRHIVSGLDDEKLK